MKTANKSKIIVTINNNTNHIYWTHNSIKKSIPTSKLQNNFDSIYDELSEYYDEIEFRTIELGDKDPDESFDNINTDENDVMVDDGISTLIDDMFNMITCDIKIGDLVQYKKDQYEIISPISNEKFIINVKDVVGKVVYIKDDLNSFLVIFDDISWLPEELHVLCKHPFKEIYGWYTRKHDLKKVSE